ncbi:MAG: glutamate mutase L [Anaerolineales bacterium]
MDTTTISAKSVIALDIGNTITRALFFDVVSGRYRFLAAGSAPTTAGAPIYDVTEGVWRAIEELQYITSRKFLSEKEGIMIPSTQDNQGVDIMVATMSAGNPISVITVGLLDHVSLRNARHLSQTTYSKIIAEISLNDRRTSSDRINLLTEKHPELIIITGGTDQGASRSLLSILESIGLSSYLMDESQKPHILYTGNEELQEEVKSGLGKISKLRIAPNIQPVLGKENIYPAQNEINEIYKEVRKGQTGGIRDVISWTEGHFNSTASAFDRVIRFLSEKYEPEKGVLGVDIGSYATIISAAQSGQETLRVFPNLGVGAGCVGILEESSLEDITRWLPFHIPDQKVRDYIHNKSSYPSSLPNEVEHLEIEFALAKQALRIASEKIIPSLQRRSPSSSLLPPYEPIIGSGRILTHAPTRSHSLAALLDGIQPTGVTTIALDQNGLLPGLGAISEINPLLTVQVIEANTLLNLGTIIAPIGSIRPGTPILRVRINREDGRSFTREIKFGSLAVLPVEMGEKVSLHLRPLHRFDVGMGGPGKSGKVNAVGGALGIIIDARGRPLRFFQDQEKNWKRNETWIKTLQKYE